MRKNNIKTYGSATHIGLASALCLCIGTSLGVGGTCTGIPNDVQGCASWNVVNETTHSYLTVKFRASYQRSFTDSNNEFKQEALISDSLSAYLAPGQSSSNADAYYVNGFDDPLGVWLHDALQPNIWYGIIKMTKQKSDGSIDNDWYMLNHQCNLGSSDMGGYITVRIRKSSGDYMAYIDMPQTRDCSPILTRISNDQGKDLYKNF